MQPDLHHQDADDGVMKILMAGSASDPLDWQHHLRGEPRRAAGQTARKHAGLVEINYYLYAFIASSMLKRSLNWTYVAVLGLGK